MGRLKSSDLPVLNGGSLPKNRRAPATRRNSDRRFRCGIAGDTAGSSGQTLASLGAPISQNPAPAHGRHAAAETVPAFADELARLKGAFQGDDSHGQQGPVYTVLPWRSQRRPPPPLTGGSHNGDWWVGTCSLIQAARRGPGEKGPGAEEGKPKGRQAVTNDADSRPAGRRLSPWRRALFSPAPHRRLTQW